MKNNSNSSIFRSAIAGATSALGDKSQKSVIFSNIDSVSTINNQIQLPFPHIDMKKTDLGNYRGAADSAALWIKYHNSSIHDAHIPKEPKSQEIFESCERSRIDSLGAQKMKGVAFNLNEYLSHQLDLVNIKDQSQSNDVPLHWKIRLILQACTTKDIIPDKYLNNVELWKSEINNSALETINKMAASLYDQIKFSKLTRFLLSDLGILDDSIEIPPTKNNSLDQATLEEESDTNKNLISSNDSQTEILDYSNEEEKYLIESMKSELNSSMLQSSLESMSLSNDSNNFHKINGGKNLLLNYRPFTTEFDTEIDAGNLSEIDELIRLRNSLDNQLVEFKNLATKLANRLQRFLLAKQTRSWEFDLDEGIVDGSRLARIIANPEKSLSYKQEKSSDFRDTVVTLLLDNSGSMRGRPITVAALSADILTQTLERCGIKVEVLGFTTKTWKGGSSREHWITNGKPSNPGRLNDILHIIYKNADEPFRRARTKFGLMLKEGLLKENIDGEALIWAHNRLQERHEQRKILMVISDGAPVDDSTLSTNENNYLENHLRHVIKWIENFSSVELTAIGIGHDVMRYYSRAITIVDTEQLGDAMMNQLVEMFKNDRKKPISFH